MNVLCSLHLLLVEFPEKARMKIIDKMAEIE